MVYTIIGFYPDIGQVFVDTKETESAEAAAAHDEHEFDRLGLLVLAVFEGDQRPKLVIDQEL